MISLPPRYAKIVKVLPGGGMSHTVHCFDANLQRDVVIKSLKTGIAPYRLQDELSALSSIRSRYVVQILDIIKDASGNIIGFVEEYLPGSELIPCASGFSAQDALRALYPIAAGIAEVHGHGRVHRDIKPDNMRYDANGQLKIFDFGLAKDQLSVGTSSFYFSPGFTAPEAFMQIGGLHTYTPAVDVFAFGCVAIWLLNNGSLPSELSSMPPSSPLPSFSFAAIAPTLPPHVTSLLDACLEGDPLARPKMEDLRRVLAGELLRDRHRMVLTQGQQIYTIDKMKRSIRLVWQSTSSITIMYDGIAFSVSAVTGTVMINNAAACVGQRLSGSCVIVLGVDDPSSGLRRASVTADISHPEVTL